MYKSSRQIPSWINAAPGWLLASLLTGGCTVGPDYVEPDYSAPSTFQHAPEPTAERPQPRDSWTDVFDDPELAELVRQVRSENRELIAAARRLDQARTALGLARAEGLPQVSSAPLASRQRISEEEPGPGGGETVSLYSAPISVAWEWDVVGRIRRSREAALADAQARQEDYQDILLLLEAETASSYYALRTIDLEMDLLDESVALRRETVELTRKRFELGVVDELDVAQARTLLALSEADLLRLRRQRETLLHALAVLAGLAASDLELARRPLDRAPPSVPAGLPSELLKARPDIRRTERAVAAENARVGIATAAFYPSITLSGSAGLRSGELSSLLEGRARFWSILPQVFLPIFQGGRNQANLEVARARYEEALASYEQTVLVAFAEVETALASARLVDDEIVALMEAAEAARRARDLSLIKYEGGIGDYLSVLEAERTALDTELQLARLRGLAFGNAVSLIRALGGRW